MNHSIARTAAILNVLQPICDKNEEKQTDAVADAMLLL